MPASAETILAQFADQASACDSLGSPFTAKLCRLLAERLDTGNAFGRRILEWPGDPYADNVALRAAGALHALARSGWEPDLAAVYPPAEVSDHTLWVAIVGSLSRHSNFLAERLSSAPQTNEVARSALILGAMLRIAEATRLPLEIYEIGASAGLNLEFDRYRYDLGEGRRWGLVEAPLTIECPWSGNLPPLDAPLRIVGRHGCDLRPIDATNAGDRERLLSYIWADQTKRFARIETALAMAGAQGPRVEKAEAEAWLRRELGKSQPNGVVRVVFHTIVWQYLPGPTRSGIEALFAQVQADASVRRPFARVSIEADASSARGARMELTLSPGGETITLGRGDFHGRWAEWA
jgi:hypothetical protein